MGTQDGAPRRREGPTDGARQARPALQKTGETKSRGPGRLPQADEVDRYSEAAEGAHGGGAPTELHGGGVHARRELGRRRREGSRRHGGAEPGGEEAGGSVSRVITS